MDWNHAIAHNQRQLSVIVAGLLALMSTGASRSQLLAIIRPAESAVRRLIILVMRHGGTRHNMRPVTAPEQLTALPKTGPRSSSFCLIDPRKRFDRNPQQTDITGPRIWVLGMTRNMATKSPQPAPTLTTLQRRIDRLRHALDNLPREARRMARLMTRRDNAPPGPRRIGPVRPGLPPGWRSKPHTDIDLILRDCHALVVGGVWRPPKHITPTS